MELTSKKRDELIDTLKERFEKNMNRHVGLPWVKVLDKLQANPEKIWSLSEMERTGGEPDVIGYDAETGVYTFCDCSEESPKGRRSLCYDNAALMSRKENKPENSAVGMALDIGINLLTEEEYCDLQKYGKFDTKTSSWLATPASVRKLGGAIFGDFRYGRVFLYHNGVESYYGVRGFRGSLKI